MSVGVAMLPQLGQRNDESRENRCRYDYLDYDYDYDYDNDYDNYNDAGDIPGTDVQLISKPLLNPYCGSPPQWR